MKIEIQTAATLIRIRDDTDCDSFVVISADFYSHFSKVLKHLFYLMALPYFRGIVEFMTVILLVPNVIYKKLECIFHLFNIAKEKGVRETCTKAHNYPNKKILLNNR